MLLNTDLLICSSALCTGSASFANHCAPLFQLKTCFNDLSYSASPIPLMNDTNCCLISRRAAERTSI